MRISLLFLCIGSAFALNPIVIKGSKFFDSVTKKQFFIKGIAYQPRGGYHPDNTSPDPLADPAACARDAPLMAKLKTNVIRVYEIDPKRDHDECMKIFEDAGIYLLLDIATPHFSVNRKAPEYDVRLYNAYKATVDAFLKYKNILGFIAGNEVTNDKKSTLASAYVKAALRDTKTYLKEKKKNIPVGYASNDDEYIRDPIKDYFNCGDEESQVDFYGLNLYEWCGSSSYESSGYKARTEELLQYNKPVFLSEYGCNIVTPRQFSEVGAVYGPEMTEVWSGGVVYEWTQENNRYGLVKIDSNGEAEILPDYTNLLSEMEDINPKGVHMDSFKEAKEKSVCPPNGSNWKASATLPPTPSDGACECMVQNMQCVASDKVSLITGPAGNSTLGDQLDVMCGMVGCNDISGDPEKGEYGMFSYCTPRDKLSWLYNLKASEKRAGNTCDFSGYGQEISPKRNDLASCAMIKPNTNIGDYSDDNTSILNQSSAVLSRKISSGTFSATVIFVVAAIFFV